MPIIKSKLLTKNDVVNFNKTATVGQTMLDGENLYLYKNKTSTVWKIRTRTKLGNSKTLGWKTIGQTADLDLKAARKEADKMRGILRQNINLNTYQHEQKLLGKSFGEVLDLYVKENKSKLRPTSIRKFNSVMSNINVLNNTIMEKITENEISELVAKIKVSSPSIATILLREIKSIYSFAYEEKFLQKRLDFRIKAKYKVNHRERYLEEDKLGKFFNELFDDNDVPLAIKTAIYSLFILMLRREELLTLEWSDINLKAKKLVVKQTKKITNFKITIPTQLVEALIVLREQNPLSQYVFSSRESHYSGDTLCRFCKKLGVKYGIGEFTPHDARRTAMTLLSDRNHPYKVIDMALGHIPLGVNKHYLKTNMSSSRATLLQDWADLIDTLARK